MSTVLIDIHRMVDLALGTPEAGVVNFNALRSLLHVMAQKLNMQNSRIEFDGEQKEKVESMIGISQNALPLISVEEFCLQKIQENDRTVTKRIPISQPQTEEIDKIIVVKKIDNKNITSNSDDIPINPVGRSNDLNASEDNEERKTRERSDNSDTDHKEPNNVLGLTHNTQDLKSGQSDDDQQNTHDDNTLISTNRLDAIEIRLEKFCSTLQRLSDEYETLYQLINEREYNFGSNDFLDLNLKVDRLNESNASRTEIMRANDVRHFEDIHNLRNEVDSIQHIIHDVVSEIPKLAAAKRSQTIFEAAAEDLIAGNDKIKAMPLESKPDDEKNHSLECQTVPDIQSPVDDRSARRDFNNLKDLSAELKGMKVDLEETIERCNGIIGENHRLSKNIEILNEKTDAIEYSKVDKVDLDNLLAEKVNHQMLERKVNIENFDATKNDLSNRISEIFQQNIEIESNFAQRMENFSGILKNHVNKSELLSQNDKLDKKFQSLEKLLNSLEISNQHSEAAGTKLKHLRDVTCISCNKDVIMRMKEENTVGTVPLRPHKSLKPMLTYKLHKFRKQMENAATTKNMNQLASILRNKHAIGDVLSSFSKRYCGGSHTVITPESRIQRIRQQSKFPQVFNKQIIDDEDFLTIRSTEAARKLALNHQEKSIASSVNFMESENNLKPRLWTNYTKIPHRSIKTYRKSNDFASTMALKSFGMGSPTSEKHIIDFAKEVIAPQTDLNHSTDLHEEEQTPTFE